MNAETIMHNAKLNGETLTEQEIKNRATKQDQAKFLLFETPLGKVWFDGENCIDAKTGKVVPFTEICKYVLNPEDGNIYYLKTDQNVKPGTITLVAEEQDGGKTDDGMGGK